MSPKTEIRPILHFSTFAAGEVILIRMYEYGVWFFK